MASPSNSIEGITLAHTVLGDFFLPEDGPLHTEVRETGGHVRSGVAMLQPRLGPGQTVVDLGAGVGILAVALQHLVGHDGRVWCFEPDPDAFALLRWNLALNGVDLSARAVAGADWPRLDEWCRAQGIDRIDALRVHGPAAASSLAEGGLGTLGTHRPLILLTREWGSPGKSAEAGGLEKELRGLGYAFMAGAGDPEAASVEPEPTTVWPDNAEAACVLAIPEGRHTGGAGDG